MICGTFCLEDQQLQFFFNQDGTVNVTIFDAKTGTQREATISDTLLAEMVYLALSPNMNDDGVYVVVLNRVAKEMTKLGLTSKLDPEDEKAEEYPMLLP